MCQSCCFLLACACVCPIKDVRLFHKGLLNAVLLPAVCLERKQAEWDRGKRLSISLSLILPGNCPISLYPLCVCVCVCVCVCEHSVSSCRVQHVWPAFTSSLFCFAFHSNNLHMVGVMVLCFFLHEMDRIELMTAQTFSTAFTVLYVTQTHTQLLKCLYPYKHWQIYSKLQEDTDIYNYISYAQQHNKCAFKRRHARTHTHTHTPPTNACYRFGLIVLTSMCLS